MKDQEKSISYCCFSCDGDCNIYKATKANDISQKTEIAKKWSQQYGKQYKAEDVYCLGCKTDSFAICKVNCTVRECALEKGVDSCAHCKELVDCQKDLWLKWPKVRENAIRIQHQLNI